MPTNGHIFRLVVLCRNRFGLCGEGSKRNANVALRAIKWAMVPYYLGKILVIRREGQAHNHRRCGCSPDSYLVYLPSGRNYRLAEGHTLDAIHID